jgi:CRP-like cAMP-binding protein
MNRVLRGTAAENPTPSSGSQDTGNGPLSASTRHLERCVLFRDMNPAELDAVFNLMQAEDFQAGEEILTEGLTYHSLWIILSGRCEVVKAANGGKPNQLAVLETGGVFGEMSFLDSAPHSASVRALSDVSTMRLMRDAFDQLRQSSPSAADRIACNMVLVLSERLRRMDEWTCELVQSNGNERQHAEWQEFRAKLYSGLPL